MVCNLIFFCCALDADALTLSLMTSAGMLGMWSFVVFSKMVVGLLVHLDVVDDNAASISSERTCCSTSFDRTCCCRQRRATCHCSSWCRCWTHCAEMLWPIFVGAPWRCTFRISRPLNPKELVVRCQRCKRVVLLSVRSMSLMNFVVIADPETLVAELLLQNFCWTCCWDWRWPADWK